MAKRLRSPFGEFFLTENFPRVELALREGRFSALGSPDEWEITPEDAYEIGEYCRYVLKFYRRNKCGTSADRRFFEYTTSKVDNMLASGGYLWKRPSVLEQDIESGRQLTLDIG